MTLSDLAREITSGAVRLAAATAAWLRLVAEFDRREGWSGVGILSCAHWLSWQCGVAPGTAREHVRVARALEALPLISGAFAEGRLSYSKVRALTRIAEPDSEQALLETAIEATAAQTERLVRGWRRAERIDATTIALKRQFEHWWDDDGMLVVRMRMDSEEGAHFLAAVDSIAEREARRDRAAAKRAVASVEAGALPGHQSDGADPDGVEQDELACARERTAARRCAAVARLALAARDADRRPGDPPRREVVVHVDAAVLADDAAAGQAYLDGGPALHPAQVRRMLCEATVVTMLESGREVLGVGRRRRRATGPQRRALLRRDGGCARSGCTETRIERLHAHHMRHWLFGGGTDLDNLVLLCDVDHGLVHDLDLVLTRRDGRLIALAPDGRRVWGAADAAFAGGLGGVVLRPDDVGDAPAGSAEPFAGIHPIDEPAGRRPGAGPVRWQPESATASASAPAHGEFPIGDLESLLFPDGSPVLPEGMHVNGERMDLAWVVGVLMGNRDLRRRLAAEARGGPALVA
nr:HNH endonuclease signature motif containing protein [Blastococcus saxobsidens]